MLVPVLKGGACVQFGHGTVLTFWCNWCYLSAQRFFVRFFQGKALACGSQRC
jgi:hypothetical protein